MARRSAGKRTLRGRVAQKPCASLGDDRVCEPLNRVWLLDPSGKVTKRYASCTCGTRFPPSEVPRELPAVAVEVVVGFADGHDEQLDETAMARVVRNLWPVDQESDWARDGVVPVGQAVLHEPTRFVDGSVEPVMDLAERLLLTQEDAEGIGLAANQVGAPVRALAQNLTRVAPPILLNPTLLEASGHWRYEEGCLSLHVEGTPAEVVRPKVILVHAELLDGGQIVVEADELFARVLQHELDHLDGIEYVQRLTGSTAERVYALMDKAGIDTGTWLPPRPYDPAPVPAE